MKMLSRAMYGAVLFAVVALCVLLIYIKPQDALWPWEVSVVKDMALSGDEFAVKKLYYHYLSMPSGRKEADDWLKIGASDGLPEIQYMYATVIKNKDPDVAACWYGRSAIGGYGKSAYITALNFNSSGDLQQYKQWLTYAAALGHLHAKLDLADVYLEYNVKSSDKVKSAHALYSEVIEKAKKGSVFYKRAEDGLGRIGREFGEVVGDKDIDISDVVITKEMKVSIDKLCK